MTISSPDSFVDLSSSTSPVNTGIPQGSVYVLFFHIILIDASQVIFKSIFLVLITTYHAVDAQICIFSEDSSPEIQHLVIPSMAHRLAAFSII